MHLIMFMLLPFDNKLEIKIMDATSNQSKELVVKNHSKLNEVLKKLNKSPSGIVRDSYDMKNKSENEIINDTIDFFLNQCKTKWGEVLYLGCYINKITYENNNWN